MSLRRLRHWALIAGLTITGGMLAPEARAQTDRPTQPTLQQGDVVVPPTPTRRPAASRDKPVLVDARPAPAPVASLQNIALPEGTPLPVRPTRRLSSSVNRSGDRFEAVLDEDLTNSAGQVLLPRGTIIKGRLENVLPGGKVSGRAEMTLLADSLELGGQNYPIESEPIQVRARGTKARDARNIGIAAGIGAAIGAIFGGAKGAAVGATIGGGASTARVITSRGKEAVIEKEQLVTFSLARALDTREESPAASPTRP